MTDNSARGLAMAILLALLMLGIVISSVWWAF